MELTGLKIAHRGIFDNLQVPENSLLAFQKARDLQLPIELDVQLTKDNVLVVFHDVNLKRMCGISGYLEDYTWEQLRKLTLLKTPEHIPSLQEVLLAIRGRVLIDIEIKQTKDYQLLCRLLLQQLKTYSGNVILKSFQPSIVRFLKKKTKIPVGLLLTEYPPSKLYSYFISSSLLVTYCNPDFLAINKKIIHKQRIQKMRIKRPVLVWTILSSSEFQSYSLLADSFLCNSLPY